MVKKNKPIVKVVIHDHRKERNPFYNYNAQIWHSYDGGKTFAYVGIGRFTKTKKEALQFKKQALTKG